MIVVLTEEPSMKVTVEALLRNYYPHLVQGMDWFVFPFHGKSDLEKNILPKMRDWNYGAPDFLILRDADGADCVALKQRLTDLATPSARPFRVRIVCQELESWFLGDSIAVATAYPRCRFSNETAKYRNPDRLTNASQELLDLTCDRSKKGRAERIAPFLDPPRNCSRSFQVFVRTLQHLLA